MKKIISILCVMAMVLSFAAFSVNAADNEITITVKEQTEEKTVLSVSMKTNYTISSVQAYVDVKEAITAGATVSATAVKALSASYKQNMVLISFIPTDGATFTGEVELATITITPVDSAYTVKKQAESSRTKFTATAKDPNGGADISVQSNIDFTSTLTVEPFSIGGGEEEVNTVAVVGEPVAVTADTINGELTDYQIGSGLGMTVNTEATFNKMKWAITTADGRLFSKTIALPNVTGEFKVAATFINGSHENEFGKEVVAPVEFSEVGAIFSDGEADYFTNADDAALKAE